MPPLRILSNAALLLAARGALALLFLVLAAGEGHAQIQAQAVVVGGNFTRAAKADDKPELTFVERFRPLLATELSFIRMTCDIPAADRPRIKEAGEEALREVSKQLFALQQNQARGLFGGNGVDNSFSPPKIIQEALAASVKKTLPAEALTQFVEESGKRRDRARHAATMVFVARLDNRLKLSAEQRKKLEDSLAAHWQASWTDEWPRLAQYDFAYQPYITDESPLECLTAEQKRVWSTSQKINLGSFYYWLNQNDLRQGEADLKDPWWDG